MKLNVIKNINFLIIILIVPILLSSCASINTLSKHSNLQVDSYMSNSIFLDPSDPEHSTVFVQVKNTTTEQLTSLTDQIKQRLVDGGWKVVNTPSQANNILQVNILQYGMAKDFNSVKAATDSGFGSITTGALAGVGAGYLLNSSAAGIGVGVGAAVLSWVANEQVKNKAYSIISDIQVSVKNTDNSWKKYTSRISSIAQKVNLKFNEAKPLIVSQQAKEIAGILISSD